MKFELKTKYQIESARYLPNLSKDHPCSRTHGHSFSITLRMIGEQDPKIGWVRDYHEIDSVAKKVLNEIDHRLLNEVPGLNNPTSENLAVWIFEKLKPQLKELIQVTICETLTTECSYPVL